jgi:DNA-binding CsgD family transcriptional regulator
MNIYTIPASELPLSIRERLVLTLYIGGIPQTEIAAMLKIKPRTIHNYLDKIQFKLDLHGRRALKAWALKNGYSLVPIGSEVGA